MARIFCVRLIWNASATKSAALAVMTSLDVPIIDAAGNGVTDCPSEYIDPGEYLNTMPTVWATGTEFPLIIIGGAMLSGYLIQKPNKAGQIRELGLLSMRFQMMSSLGTPCKKKWRNQIWLRSHRGSQILCRAHCWQNNS